MHNKTVRWTSADRRIKAEITVITHTDSNEDAIMSAESLFLLSMPSEYQRELVHRGTFTVLDNDGKRCMN